MPEDLAEAATPRPSQRPPEPRKPRNQAKRSALAGFFGGMLEYYDMSIYASASSLVFARIFFPDAGASALLLSLGTFGVAYVARPLGGVISGHIGDRFGRKRVMVLTLLVMGVATFLVGCLPSYGSIGVAAPVLLVVLRLVQGISVGGETSGSISLTLEHSPQDKRTLYTGWQTSGIWFGYIVAGVVFVMVTALPDDKLLSWGWRIPFWVSAVIVVVGLIIRSTIQEPEIFDDVKEDEEAMPKAPIVVLLKHQPGDVVRVVLMALLVCFANIMMVFGLAYATSVQKISSTTMLWVFILGYAGCIAVLPLAARVSDRWGRRPTLIVSLLISVPAVFFFFWAISTRNVPLIAVATLVALSLAFGSTNIVYPVFFAEQFDVRYRVSGMALGLQIGAVISGFAPTISQALAGPQGDVWWPACAFSAAASFIAAIAVFFSRETFRTPLHQLGKR